MKDTIVGIALGVLVLLVLIIACSGCSEMKEFFAVEPEPSADPNGAPAPSLSPGEKVDLTMELLFAAGVAAGIPGALFGKKLVRKLRPGKAIEETVRGN